MCGSHEAARCRTAASVALLAVCERKYGQGLARGLPVPPASPELTALARKFDEGK